MVHKKSHAQYFALFMLQIKTVFRPRMGGGVHSAYWLASQIVEWGFT